MKNRILIVEDDRAISDAVALNMQFVGYDYMVFDDGEKAASCLATDHAFDLAILDIMLPGINGFELFSYTEKYNIPVIYMTAKTDAASEIKGLRDGAEDYIVKPFEIIELLARVETVLRRYGKEARLLRFEDVEADTLSRTVRKAGIPVKLTVKEYELLLFLVTNADTVFDRETLYERIWGMDALGDNATVAVHINRLREKLEEDPSHPKYIETVWGAGYRFHA